MVRVDPSRRAGILLAHRMNPNTRPRSCAAMNHHGMTKKAYSSKSPPPRAPSLFHRFRSETTTRREHNHKVRSHVRYTNTDRRVTTVPSGHRHRRTPPPPPIAPLPPSPPTPSLPPPSSLCHRRHRHRRRRHSVAAAAIAATAIAAAAIAAEFGYISYKCTACTCLDGIDAHWALQQQESDRHAGPGPQRGRQAPQRADSCVNIKQ